ncbi:MAG: SCP2 sterol-binding domain-containing protein [Myxococcales bacterium]|nr:SCP2 sterol-binding domain-containing protein [Myxococcales bacterium]
MTPQQLFEDQIAKRLTEDASLKEIDAVYQFNVTGDNGGEWTVDLRAGAVKAGNDADADCTIGIADSDLINLVEGTVNGPQLFMGGLIQIEGDMSLAMRLQSVLGG